MKKDNNDKRAAEIKKARKALKKAETRIIAALKKTATEI